MNSQNRKALSWSVSIIIHGTLLFFLVSAGLHYAFPEGEVTTNTTSFEVVGNSKAGQIEAAKPNKNSVSMPEKKSGIEKASAHDSSEPKLIPYQENSGIKATAPDQEEPEKKQEEKVVEKPEPVVETAALPPKNKPETQTEETTEKNKDDEANSKTEAMATPPMKIQNENLTVGDPNPATQQEAQPPIDGAQNKDQGGAPPPYGGPGSTLLDESTLAELPGNKKPSYPWLANLRRQEGTVILRAFIKKDGHVDLPILEKSSGFPLLDQESIKAYSQWRYKPGPSGWVLKPFKFNLKK